MIQYPLWAGVEYAHRFPVCRMRRLEGCTDATATTAWNYAGLLCNLYRDAGPKRCHLYQTSRAQSSLNPFYTWCDILPSGLHHLPVVSIPFLLLSYSSILHLPPLSPFLTCTRVRGNHHHD